MLCYVNNRHVALLLLLMGNVFDSMNPLTTFPMGSGYLLALKTVLWARPEPDSETSSYLNLERR